MNTAPVLALPHATYLPFFSADALIPLVFYIALALYAIFTGVLYYHWNAYAHGSKVIALTYIVYFSLTIPLLAILATTAFLT